MDSESLRTASEYLNNLLLARGLLRNGEPVDFVKPSRESRAQIINLVHDLVLRGDRDKEQREGTANAYRQLRVDEDSKKAEIERLRIKQEEVTRLHAQAQAAERMAKDDLKKVEKSMRTLQEQGVKMKTALAQVKAQCTNDIRKRDLELSRLKTHLQGQQRGNRSAIVAPSISISGSNRKPTFDTSVHNVSDPAYSLKQESNEFLTQLSQNLSDENDRLANIVRGAVLTLRELLGMQATMRGASDSGIGEDVTHNDKTLPNSFDVLASDLETTLTHLKSLLTNPNFVSIEEVEVREEEIVRMRADWEKMEQRWHDLVAMLNGWKKRMNAGEIINKDDIRKGMGLVSPNHEQTEPTISQSSAEQDSSLVDDSIAEIRHKQDADPGRISPKRKRDPLEPPESFDLRPRQQQPSRPGADQRFTASDAESEELEVPRLTIEEKLSAAAEEAAAARDDASHTTLDGAADGDTLGRMSSQVRKSKIQGRAKRRKSTLSRDELAGLLAADE
ncbi:hypothetical protein AMS68_003433 [Peltaster fructicola]|uniref:NIMA interactive protein n=1 Tax=Peltaster fructicola TaxID=286661 RepID=A0A6H0XTB8_9PEZI|nr:hypothetical protein AMS68_003433 [Peltaster fructicola]